MCSNAPSKLDDARCALKESSVDLALALVCGIKTGPFSVFIKGLQTAVRYCICVIVQFFEGQMESSFAVTFAVVDKPMCICCKISRLQNTDATC